MLKEKIDFESFSIIPDYYGKEVRRYFNSFNKKPKFINNIKMKVFERKLKLKLKLKHNTNLPWETKGEPK